MTALQTTFFKAAEIPFSALTDLQKKLYGNNRKPVTTHLDHLLGGILIFQNDQTLATACLYRNSYINEGKTLLFGNLEMIEDSSIFRMLMTAINDYAKAHHYTTLLGPVNGSTWNDYRLPVSCFGPQFLTDLPQPEYYAQYLLQSGFSVAHRYFTYRSPIRLRTINESLQQPSGMILRPIDLNNYEAELEKLFPFCNAAFANNALFSPITKEDFLQRYQQMKPLLLPDYTWLAEDTSGSLQAFILCLPDAVQPNQLVMKTIARNIHNRQSAGLVQRLADLIYNRAHKAGYRHMLHAFMHSSNRSKVLSEKYNGRLLKEYAIFTQNVQS